MKTLKIKSKQMNRAGGECRRAKWLQSCLTLGDPVHCRASSPCVPGVLQARTRYWVAMPSSRGIFPVQGSNPHLLSPALAEGFSTMRAAWEAPEQAVGSQNECAS